MLIGVKCIRGVKMSRLEELDMIREDLHHEAVFLTEKHLHKDLNILAALAYNAIKEDKLTYKSLRIVLGTAIASLIVDNKIMLKKEDKNGVILK